MPTDRLRVEHLKERNCVSVLSGLCSFREVVNVQFDHPAKVFFSLTLPSHDMRPALRISLAELQAEKNSRASRSLPSHVSFDRIFNCSISSF